MDPESIDHILDELFPNFEPLEAHSAALLQLLKAKGLVTDEELAPFLKQAADAASVRWLAVRVRVEALIATILNPPEKASFATPAAENTYQAAQSDQPEPQEENSTDSRPEQNDGQKGKPRPDSNSRKAEPVANESTEPADNNVENAA